MLQDEDMIYLFSTCCNNIYIAIQRSKLRLLTSHSTDIMTHFVRFRSIRSV